MTEESYRLKFDIYERVHLSDEVVGIEQLEEIELTPHIQVIPAGDQVTVRGSLLLAGSYVGAGDEQQIYSLEHWIPVEITLPLNRVRSLEDILVDIEHFDVDLLSTRTLNIVGILSLSGISMENIELSTWEEEPFTVVHQNQPELEKEEPSWLTDYQFQPAHTENVESDAVICSQPEYTGIDSLAESSVKEEEQLSVASSAGKIDYGDQPDKTLRSKRREDRTQETVSTPFATEKIETVMEKKILDGNISDKEDEFGNDLQISDIVTSALTNQEMKIAIGKSKFIDTELEEAVGFSSLLQKKPDSEQRKHEIEEQVTSTAPVVEDPKWQELFLQRLDDTERTFKKVRLCIVQRQETLDTIAERYCMNSREIVLYNQLSESDLTEGQVLYIPISS